MERHVHSAGHADVDLAVSRLRPFQLPKGFADGRADCASLANSAELQRPMRESRARHGLAVRVKVRRPTDEERRAGDGAEWIED